MRSIAALFGRSPFKLLEKHMEVVKEGLNEIKPLFDALYEEDYGRVKEVSEKILKLEHNADKMKNDIRSEITGNIFMPVDRRDFLNLLSAQDDIADAVEDLSIVLRLRDIKLPVQMKPAMNELVNNVAGIGDMAYKIVQELDNLMEVSFRGPEADSVDNMVTELATAEWNADKLQFKITKMVFLAEEELSKGEFFILLEIVRKLGAIADKSEKVGKILRMFLAG